MITSSVAVGDIIISIIIPHMSCISFNCNEIKIAHDGVLSCGGLVKISAGLLQ